jgi:predicted ATPase/DNA-binding CsgD family transcriptional regulator
VEARPLVLPRQLVDASQNMDERARTRAAETTRDLANAPLTATEAAGASGGVAPLLPFAARPGSAPIQLVEREAAAAVRLPRPLTTLVGRQQEIAAITALLSQPEVRLLNLTGPGGVGKTRLAIEVASSQADSLADGVAFVSLAAVDRPALVASTVVQAFGLREIGSRSSLEHLVHYLHARSMLLVLDNFEHVVEAAPLLTSLLADCPRLKLLVTSRSPLAVAGERQFPVRPLSVETEDGRRKTEVRSDPAHQPPSSFLRLPSSPAVQLFVERAQAELPDFALTAENASTVAAICERLEGLPLAIELAAARVRLLSAEALLDRMQRSLPLLTGGRRDAPARQRTMRDAIAWSHDLLTLEEQALFRRLAVFMGGCTLEGAEAVAAAFGVDSDVLGGIAGLVDASLLRQEPGAADASRLTMLETVREFALEMLAASGEERAARQNHAEYFQLLAERAHDAALRGSFRSSLVDDLANLRAALGWLEQAGEAEQSLKLAGALWPIWYVRGPYHEGRAWVERALARGGDNDAAARGRAMLACGLLAIMQGDVTRAESCFAEALPIARRGGFPLAEANALLGFLWVAVQNDELARAEELGEEALALIWTTDDPQVAKVTAGMILDNLGSIAFVQGDFGLATTRFTEALAHQREVNHHWGEANSLTGLGYVARARGDDQAAREAFRAALPLFGAHEDVRKIALALAGVSGLALSGHAAQAARLIGAVAALREADGLALDPEYRAIYERDEAAARAALGETAFAEAWSEGAAMPLEAALALADAILDTPPLPEAAPPTALFGLTPRELEVLRLIANGHSDRQIADVLFISPNTVMRHVQHILAKLDVESRTAAASQALRLGLV